MTPDEQTHFIGMWEQGRPRAALDELILRAA